MENYSGIVQKIRARQRGYPCPPAPENQGIHRKNVSYPCQASTVGPEMLIELVSRS